MKKKILVAVYNPIEVDGRVKRQCEHLSLSFDLTLLCVSPKLGKAEYSSPNFKIIRTNPPMNQNKIVRLLMFFFIFVKTAIKIKPNFVYANDFFLPFPGLIAAKITKAKFVYDAHELIVPAIEQQLSNKEKLFYFLEKKTIRYAQLVIAANSSRAEIMKNHYHLNKVPLVIGNIPPIPVAKVTQEEVIRMFPVLMKEHPGDIHVVYMGDINFVRGIDVLLDAVKYLPENVKLIFVGGGVDLENVKKVAKEIGKNKIRITGQVPHDMIFDILKHADIGFISYLLSKNLNDIYCAPNKIFEYAQAGLPVISTCQPTIKKIFSEFQIGELFGCNGSVEPEEVGKTLLSMINNLSFYKKNIEPFLNTYKWESEALKLSNGLENILNQIKS
jgi:glycosyltransferase involved in cell wall biosynthesis